VCLFVLFLVYSSLPVDFFGFVVVVILVFFC
jgi:hypothetical protein